MIVLIYTNAKKKVCIWLNGTIFILKEAKYRQIWYQNVQKTIGYTIFYF